VSWWKATFVHNGGFVTLADVSPDSEWGGGRLICNSNHKCLFVQPPSARPLSFRSGIMRGVPRDCIQLDPEGVDALDERGVLEWRNARSRRFVERLRAA
jgi:hypothetical protein